MRIDELNRLLDDGRLVYEHYCCPNLQLGKKMLSPLRNERNPSFSLYRHQKSGLIWWKDQGGEGKFGNHWTFVMEYFGLNAQQDGFKEAVALVKRDVLNIHPGQELNYVPVKTEFKRLTAKPSIIEPVLREWRKSDLDWWGKFEVNQSILEQYEITPAERFTLQSDKGEGVKTYRWSEQPSDPIYAIRFTDEELKTKRWKMYRPLTDNPKRKWCSNTVSSKDIFGYRQLPATGDKLFIIAGNKDTVSFRSVIGLPVCALNSETALLTPERYLEFSGRFKNIYTIGDDDKKLDKQGRPMNTGQKFAQRLYKEYGIVPANAPIVAAGVNDFADLVVSLGKGNYGELRDWYRRLP